MAAEIHVKGESKNIEYKVALPDRSIKYTKTAVAFANGEGGAHRVWCRGSDVACGGCAVFTIMDAISNAIADSCEPLMIILEGSMQDMLVQNGPMKSSSIADQLGVQKKTCDRHTE